MTKMTALDLKHRRERLGLSQAALASRFGVHPMTVSKWERGTHAIPEMVGMALAYLDAERDGEGGQGTSRHGPRHGHNCDSGQVQDQHGQPH